MGEKQSQLTYVMLGLLITAVILAGTSVFIALSYPGTATPNVTVPSYRESQQEDTITVVGSAYTYVKPDMLSLTVGVETEAETAEEAAASNAETMEAVVAALKQLGIAEEDMATPSYSVTPIYVYPKDGEPIITGYKVVNMLRVKTDKLDAAGKLIDAAVKAGANRVYGLYFYVSQEKAKQLRAELIGEAVKDAKSKAEELLEPLGLQIIRAKSASIIEWREPPVPLVYPGKVGMEATATPVMPGEQQVSLEVQITFVIGKVS